MDDNDLSKLREKLNQRDDPQLDALCLDHFPEVYDQFGRGMRRDEKINLLLAYCRKYALSLGRLQELLGIVRAPASGLSWEEHPAFKTPLQKGMGNLNLLIQGRARAVGQFWRSPYGEPEWVEIPAGEFWMGGEMYDDEKPMHQVYLERYAIARTPVTNAQYRLFVEATKYKVSDHWKDGRPPSGKENHPVVYVSWKDAMAYCRWLSQVTGKPITLPSEAEWEKAARGDRDRREYPWGEWAEGRANTEELGLKDTTPVGIFPEGASPYGCLDMASNVWEWTRSLWGQDWGNPEFKYPYQANDGREDMNAKGNVSRVLRGGSWTIDRRSARCAYRLWNFPASFDFIVGLRVLLSLVSADSDS